MSSLAAIVVVQMKKKEL